MKKTKYFFDTEFHCFKWRGVNTIQLISIGIIDENGKELYLISNEFSTKKAWANWWIRKNVCMKLDNSITNYRTFKDFINTNGINRLEMKERILAYCDDKPEFWAYYASYDWVVFCWIFGNMIDLPSHFPQYPMDLMNVITMFNIDKSKLKIDIPNDNLHNALDDAKWNMNAWNWINNYGQLKE